jgi:hypothetical protein
MWATDLQPSVKTLFCIKGRQIVRMMEDRCKGVTDAAKHHLHIDVGIFEIVNLCVGNTRCEAMAWQCYRIWLAGYLVSRFKQLLVTLS